MSLIAAVFDRYWAFFRRRLLNPSLCKVLREPVVSALSRVVWLAHFSKWLRVTGCQITHRDRYELYQSIVDRVGGHGVVDYLEFGVHRGESLKWWIGALKNPTARLYGFDVFTGLPEEWGALPRGAFDCQGSPPDISDRRVQFEVGLFQSVLPAFLERYLPNGSRKKIVHLDADLYSSTLFVLSSLARQLRPGDVLVFDEFGSVRNPTHEFRAFHDFCAAFQPCYIVLGATALYEQVAIEIVGSSA